MAKRGEDAVGGQLVEAKRPRTELVASGAGASGGGALAVSGPARTSDLLSPIMLLTGHTGQVLTTKFSPTASTCSRARTTSSCCCGRSSASARTRSR